MIGPRDAIDTRWPARAPSNINLPYTNKLHLWDGAPVTDLDLRQIRHFLVVAEKRSFTEASLSLHISQPALSQSIRRLESTLGVPLLVRGPRGSTRAITLSAGGEALFAAASDLLTQADAAVKAVRSQTTAIDLRVGFSTSTPREMTSAAVEAANQSENVNLSLSYLTWGTELDALRTGAVDILFLQGRGRALPPDAEWHVVARVQRVAVFPAAHPLAVASSVHIDDLDDIPIVDAHSDRDFWIVNPRPSHREPQVVGPPARTIEEMLAAVAAGRGMAITTASIASRSGSSDLAFVPLAGVDSATIYLGRRRSDRRLQVAALTQQILEDAGTAWRAAEGARS
jgi:DNA-binding transcriptional LysR family regulator